MRMPTGRFLVGLLAKHPAFDGMAFGAGKAEMLWNEFGDSLPGILASGQIERLISVLSETTARTLVARWPIVREEVELACFLDQNGFDDRLGMRIQTVWPRGALQKLRENPYRMLVFAPWQRVDDTARSCLGVTMNDERRCQGAVQWTMSRWLNQKHTVIPEAIAVDRVAGLLASGVPTPELREKARATIDLAVKQRRLVHRPGGLQSLGVRSLEAILEHAFRSRIEGWTDRENAQTIRTEALRQAVSAFRTETGFSPTEEQVAGVDQALTRGLSLLTGGAGTGKTTVLRMVHTACEKLGIHVQQIALAGRAAHRLRQTTGRDAQTIASYLRKHEDSLLQFEPERMLIVEESSMVDLPAFYRIVKTLSATTRLLLAGDPYQLPPIGYGLVFHKLVAEASVPAVKLRQVHRQEESTGIPQVARSIRYGEMPKLPFFQGPYPGVSFVAATSATITDNVISVAETFGTCDDVQILGVTRYGPAGTRTINSILHKMKCGDKQLVRGRDLAEGDPVVYKVNDYARALWNGSLGRILKVEADSITCEFDGTEHWFDYCDLENIELAYSLTVHRAQGSQFNRVIIPVLQSRLLDRSLLYTALTRGIEQVVLLGDLASIREAVEAPPHSHKRIVGFSL
ncbi:MAG TPA: AAA family ATPase [Acidobacteriota bacterium]|nr:AAA family ATPase [Acidobacteriota bacterium]